MMTLMPDEGPEGPRLEDFAMSARQWKFEVAIIDAMHLLMDEKGSYEDRASKAYCRLYNALVGDDVLRDFTLPEPNMGDNEK